ncbi:MAG: twin-arginine translocase TatA/TatE family subunit [Bacteroidales bacterium]|nr:twin-arginine translocase TatA/TatE family subunit [Bacteroidales bacterium]
MHLLNIGTTEIIVILLIVLLLFGGRKIPELMKGMGKGVKSFRDGMNGIEEPKKDDKPSNETAIKSIDEEQNKTNEQ